VNETRAKFGALIPFAIVVVAIMVGWWLIPPLSPTQADVNMPLHYQVSSVPSTAGSDALVPSMRPTTVTAVMPNLVGMDVPTAQGHMKTLGFTRVLFMSNDSTLRSIDTPQNWIVDTQQFTAGEPIWVDELITIECRWKNWGLESPTKK